MSAFSFRLHAVQRMFERNIHPNVIRTVVEKGEVIREYLDDKPYPSRLILGWHEEKPLHIVAADRDDADEIIIITVYEPDPNIWNADFKTKKAADS